MAWRLEETLKAGATSFSLGKNNFSSIGHTYNISFSGNIKLMTEATVLAFGTMCLVPEAKPRYMQRCVIMSLSHFDVRFADTVFVD